MVASIPVLEGVRSGRGGHLREFDLVRSGRGWGWGKLPGCPGGSLRQLPSPVVTPFRVIVAVTVGSMGVSPQS